MPKLPKIASLQYLRKEVSDDVDFGRNFQNIASRGGGGRNRLLERVDNPENWGLLWKCCGNGGCHSFYYFTVQSHLLCVWEI